jgi:hypothetical protein
MSQTPEQVRERSAELRAEIARDWYWTLGEYQRDSEELRHLVRSGGGPRRFCHADPPSRRAGELSSVALICDDVCAKLAAQPVAGDEYPSTRMPRRCSSLMQWRPS